MCKYKTNKILFRKSLPFYPCGNQVIYVEPKYNNAINDFILANYEQICSVMAELGYEFCYFPKISKKINNWRFLNYYTPYKSPIKIELYIKGRKVEDDIVDSCSMTPFLKRGFHINPSLIMYSGDTSDYRYYAFREFKISNVDNLQTFLSTFLQYINRPKEKREVREKDIIFFSKTELAEECPEDEYADREFPKEIQKIMDDVRLEIEKLRVYGVNEMVLKSLLYPRVVLSDMLITADGRIVLTDYNNIEIKMTPLVKAVYFLFLRHPEGILFKNLPDYREELLMIYKNLTGRISDEEILRSINDVTNPCKNSINEKCARIRESFVREFDDRLAEFYYITGERATAKKIRLSHKRITWEWKL